MKNKPWRKYLIFTLFCGAIYFPLFLHLGSQPIHNWDESLFAMRSAYMLEEGKYIRDYSLWVDGGVEHRSTKPPFTTWLQVASMWLLGINEFALRLPIALCVLATVFMFVWVARKTLGNIHIGYFAGFALLTSLGFVRDHGSRTGDQDAALAFYMIAGAFAFYYYLEARDNQQRLKWLVVFTVTAIAAVFTKYAFGLLFFPAFLAYAIYKKQLWTLVRQWSVWLAGALVLLLIGGWLLYMDQRLPGFLEKALFYEMADRYVSTFEGHSHPFYLYFERFWKGYFMPWLLLLLAPLYLVFSRRKSPLQDVTVLMFLCTLSLLLVISFSETKTDHYDIAVYPPLAILAGIGFCQVLDAIAMLWKDKTYQPVAFFSSLLVAFNLLMTPYLKTINRIYGIRIKDYEMTYGYIFRKIQKTQPLTKHFIAYSPSFTGQVLYYSGLLNRKKGYKIKLSEHPEYAAVGDTVLACEPYFTEYLVAHYDLRSLEIEGKCFLAIVEGKKEICE